MARTRCFFAYPSKPPRLSETVENALKDLGKGGLVKAVGWRDLKSSGKILIHEICEAIDSSPVFVCDLTNLNQNVLFEFGYAIARDRRTWVIRDPSVEPSQKSFEKFQLLTTVGYRPYQNSPDIVRQFLADQPFNDLENPLLSQAQRRRNLVIPANPVLYLKCPINTEASRLVTGEMQRRFRRSPLDLVVDDPREEVARSLVWYASYAKQCQAVLVHFMEEDRSDAQFYNAKAAFVAGLAFGFDCKLLMLASAPYDTPIDYRDLMEVHSTASQAKAAIGGWLDTVQTDFQDRRASLRKYAKRRRRGATLHELVLGDPVAENEVTMLPKYFVPTSAYREALVSSYLFLIGRRGCGKTALAYKLSSDLSSSRSEHVCLVQPRDYDLQGVLDVFDRLSSEYEFGAAADSLWRVLLYTELARSVRADLVALVPGALTDDETQFLTSLREWDDLLTDDFTSRLEGFAARIDSHRIESQGKRTDIREVLFGSVLPGLREALKMALDSRRSVTLIIDNLDKAWKPESYSQPLRDLLLGLTRVSGEMIGEFTRPDYRGRGFSLSVLVFLRSDIFISFLDVAKEKDKIPMKRMAWDDPDTLIRVIEDRFMASAAGLVETPEKIWSHYFCEDVEGLSVQQFLVSSVLPRPRDLIYLVSSALDLAIDRRHDIIEEADLIDARKEYSRNAFFSIVDEGRTRFERAEDLLFEFLGVPPIITIQDVGKALAAAGIPESGLAELVTLLCDLTFLAREVKEGNFRFVSDYRDRTQIRALAEAYVSKSDTPARFLINYPFHPYLEVQSD